MPTDETSERRLITGLIVANLLLFSCVWLLKEITLAALGGTLILLAVLYTFIAMRSSALKSEREQWIELFRIALAILLGIVLLLIGLRDVLPGIFANWPG